MEFPLRGANAVNEYKTNTMSVVRAAGGEIISVKGANSTSALEIWVQVLGSLSDFVANVVAIAKADRAVLPAAVRGGAARLRPGEHNVRPHAVPDPGAGEEAGGADPNEGSQAEGADRGPSD